MDYMYYDINHSTSKHQNHKNYYYSNFASIFIHGGVLNFKVSLRRVRKSEKKDECIR